ncbi:MAG: sulfotransferase [Frankiaceae bacterium]
MSASLCGAPALRVAFVAGLGRSGSTLLDRILGQVPGCVNVGEASQVWRALSGGVPCGCGLPARQCPFWSVVIPQVLGSWSPEKLAEALRLQRRVDRLRYLPALMLPVRFGRRNRDVRSYAELLTALYAAVAHTTGAAIVVDSGKHTSTAYLLRHVPGIDLRVIHLVRDPRGVAYSWTKVVRKSDHAGAPEMPRQEPTRVARRWLIHNVLLSILSLLDVPRHFLRYEDLVAAPRDRVIEVGRFLGMDADASRMPFLSDRVVDLRRTDHTLAGNPMRFQHDAITVALDEQWRTSLPVGRRRVVTVMTAPLLRAFGYQIWPSRATPGEHR